MIRLVSLLLLITVRTFSQSIDIEYAKSISADSMHTYLYVLASDSLEGRETGKPGQKKAAKFLADKYKEWNIPVQFQKHSLSIRANSGKNLDINNQYFVYYSNFFYVGPQSDSLFVFDKVLIAGFGISQPSYDDFAGKKVVGENLVVRWAKPEWKKKFKKNKTQPLQSKSLYQFITDLKQKDPASIFIVVDSIPELIHEIENDPILTGELHRSKQPIIFINENTAESFLPHAKKQLYRSHISHLESKCKPNPLSHSVECNLKMISDTKEMIGENVFALIEGDSKKDEYIVISSHYDHLGKQDTAIFYGADDNASGTSAVLEMARIFQKAKDDGNGPERSIIFLNVSGEEKGLWGSSFYVKHPIVPLQNTVADLNIDMIGRIDSKHDSLKVRDYIYLIGADRLSKELAEINKKANSSFTQLEFDYQFDSDADPNRYYRRSDHYNFAKNNIPIIFYFNGTHADYHLPSDTPDKIDFALAKKRAQLVFLTAWELVNRSERIKLNK